METNNNIELLEAYVNGTLTPQQQLQVETRLDNDEAFKHDYDMYQLMLSAITENRKSELKAFIGRNVRIKPAPFFKTYTFYIAAAASVVLCIISYFVVYQKLTEQQTLTNKQSNEDKIDNIATQNLDSVKPVVQNAEKNNTNVSTGSAKEKPVDHTTALTEDKNDAAKNETGLNSLSNPAEDIAVEGDQMQLDTFLDISRKIYIPKPRQYQIGPDDLYTVTITGDRRRMEVQFWQSPINYSGYKFSKNLLVIYGKFDFTQASFQELKDLIYMKYKNEYYRITPSETYTGLRKETDIKIIADLELKEKK